MDPEPWLRGPIAGISPFLMPAAHALVQVREDVERVVRDVRDEELWVQPGGAASIAYHLRHLGGALDRLYTYARGERLSESQRAALAAEATIPDPRPDAAALLAVVHRQIDAALDQLRATPENELLAPRAVGRQQLPSNVLGLLFHGAEHAQRHAGQLVTTAKIVRGLATGVATRS